MKISYKKSILFASLSLLSSTNIIQAQSIAAGGWHSLAICNDSTIKAFGENATGQLGDGTTTDRNTPVSVNGLTGIIAVSGGGDQLEAHSIALKSNGTVWAWGSNLYGGLGNGSLNNTTSPVQVLVLSGISKISAGGWHSVALKNDGTVWTWGWNTDGQLGDGTTTDKTVASQVPGLTGIVKIAAGTYHVLALKNDGTVWAWGDNVSGQIGDGSTTDRTSPVQVSGLSGVVSIAAGRFFSLAVKNDGTVWTWGENLYGQLGDGTTTDRSTPVQVSGLNNITSAVAATGAFHCMAVKNDNTVWAWGRNTYGNLGDGTTVNKSVPVQMSGVSDIEGLAAGTNFSLLHKNDGTFWGCGRNASGQLGDGTILQRNTIVQSTALCPVMNSVGLNDDKQTNSVKISAFPNPSSNGKFSLHIVNELKQKQLSNLLIEIYNVMGERILIADFNPEIKNNEFTIDLSSHSNGIYYLSTQLENYIVKQKLIKE